MWPLVLNRTATNIVAKENARTEDSPWTASMLEPEGVASKVTRKLPDWACPKRLLAHAPDDKKQTCGFTVELKLAGEAMNSRNKAKNEATRFFFDTKFFLLTSSLFTMKLFVIGTIVPIPIPCTGLP